MKKSLIILGLALLVTAGTASAQSIAVSGANAITGNFSLEITYTSPNTAQAFVSKDLGAGNAGCRISWNANANNMNLSAAANEKWATYVRVKRTNAPQRNRCIFYITRNNANTSYRYAATCREDSGTFRFVNGFFGNNTHAIEWVITPSSAPGANDGSFQVFRDGNLSGERTGLDMDDFDCNELLVGEDGGQTRQDAGGTLVVDDFVVTAL